MNKQEFINFLKENEQERQLRPRWQKSYSNSDDYWGLCLPAVDWFPDAMDLTIENVVKVNYNIDQYKDTSDEFETTYEEFAMNYDQIVNRSYEKMV